MNGGQLLRRANKTKLDRGYLDYLLYVYICMYCMYVMTYAEDTLLKTELLYLCMYVCDDVRSLDLYQMMYV